MGKYENKKSTSIKIPLRGNRTPAELQDMITQALAELEKRPFELYTNCHLYVTPVAQSDGQNRDTIEIKEPYDCAADNFDAKKKLAFSRYWWQQHSCLISTLFLWPGVKLFILGANEWSFENEWPVKRTEVVPYYLHSDGDANTPSGNGALSHDQPGSEPPDKFTYDPRDPVMSVMDIDAQAMPRDQKPLDGRRDVLVYQTEEFRLPARFVGPVELELWAASDAPDTDWTAKLNLVTRDGMAVNLTYGIMRARYREGYDEERLLDPEVPCGFLLLRPAAILARWWHRSWPLFGVHG